MFTKVHPIWIFCSLFVVCNWHYFMNELFPLHWFWIIYVKLRSFFSTMLFSKGQEEMLAHQVCMVFIWKVFKSQNKISIYFPSPDFLSTHSDCLEENFPHKNKCNFVNFESVIDCGGKRFAIFRQLKKSFLLYHTTM